MNASLFRQINLGLNFLLIALSLAAWPYLPATFAFSGYDLIGNTRLFWFVTPVATLLWNVAIIWTFHTFAGRQKSPNPLVVQAFDWCLLVGGTIPAMFFQLLVFLKAVAPDFYRASAIYLLFAATLYVVYLFMQLFLYDRQIRQTPSV